jgi:hypothetical protein
VIESVLKDVFSTHVRLQPTRDPRDADFELLIGIKSANDTKARLYSTSGVALIEQMKYHACGSGSLVDYILAQTYHDPMFREDAICSCLNLLTVAKEYVDGVGGDSHITVLLNNGTIIEKPAWEVSAEEGLTKTFTKNSTKLLLAALRTVSGTDEQFESALQSFNKEIHELRVKKKKSDEVINDLVKLWREHQEAQKKLEQEAEAAVNKVEPLDSKRATSGQ